MTKQELKTLQEAAVIMARWNEEVCQCDEFNFNCWACRANMLSMGFIDMVLGFSEEDCE